MIYAPLNYSKLNFLDNTYFPNTQKVRNNLTFSYWERSLFQRACSTLEFNLPDQWQGSIKDFFYYCLFRFGYLCVFYSPEYGLTFQPCSLKGYDIYYQPTDAIITNPAMKIKDNNRKYIIGSNCELIKLTPDYLGIWDIIDYYAGKLAVLDGAIDMSLVNNKFAFILTAKTKAMAETLKKAFDKVNRGEPLVIVDSKIVPDDPITKDSPFQYWERKLKENYITTDQLNDFQTILNNFDAEIGIPTIPYQKKERLVKSEAESRTIDSTSRSVIWYDTLTSSIERVNNMFDTNISVSLRYEDTFSDNDYTNDGVVE